MFKVKNKDTRTTPYGKFLKIKRKLSNFYFAFLKGLSDIQPIFRIVNCATYGIAHKYNTGDSCNNVVLNTF